MITRKNALCITCVAVCSSASFAWADTTEQSLIVGIAGVNAPRYSGSDQRQWQMVPVVQARDGAFFFDSVKGLGYDLQSDSGLYFEHTLGYGLGRSDKDSDWRDGSDKLRGMGNIKAVMNTAVAVGWNVTPWFVLEGKATLPLTDGQGVQYRTSATLIPVQNDTDNLAFQSAALFGDSRYMNTFYGVNHLQSDRSGYEEYNAAGGFYGVENSVSWSHQFTPHWGSTLIAGYTWLGEHASDSPIVKKHNEATVTAAFTYSF